MFDIASDATVVDPQTDRWSAGRLSRRQFRPADRRRRKWHGSVSGSRGTVISQIAGPRPRCIFRENVTIRVEEIMSPGE